MISLSLSRSSGCGNSFIGLEILYLLPPSEKHRRKLKLTMSCLARSQTRWGRSESDKLGEVVGRWGSSKVYRQPSRTLFVVSQRTIVLFCVSSHLVAGVLIETTCVIVLSLFFTFHDSHRLLDEALFTFSGHW